MCHKNPQIIAILEQHISAAQGSIMATTVTRIVTYFLIKLRRVASSCEGYLKNITF